MARNPAAVWDPLPSSSGGAFTGGPKKGVAHKVQGATYAGARGTYLSRSLGPHFTIGEDGVLYQHLDTGEASSAVANDSGGVQTNRDGAIQVEVVGFSGVPATPAQLATFVELQVWLHANEDIPPIWPAGRPPQTPEAGYGKSNGHRHPALWESTAGWYGHSQVPENTHWDPAWTDEEWAAINPEAAQEDPFMALTDAEQQEILAAVRQTVWPPGTPREGQHRLWDLMLWTLAAVKAGRVDVDEDALATALAPLISSSLGQLSDEDVERVAEAVADEQARRLGG